MLQQSLDRNNGFSEESVFEQYAQWFWNGGFDTGPTMQNVMFYTHEGLSIVDAVQRNAQRTTRTAGIGPAHRSAPLLLWAQNDSLVDLALREAKLTHWDPISGRSSAVSLLICQYLLQDVSLKDISQRIERFSSYEFCLSSMERSQEGVAPRVIETAWYFLYQTTNFEDALQQSLDFAGQDNYCPVLVGLWEACRYKEVLLSCLEHRLCPSNDNSVAVVS